MGLFDDTIRDARRPVGQWVRRSAAETMEASVEEEPAGDDSPTGMQTVFRFQKEGSPAMTGGSREAPDRGGSISRAVPLSAGGDVERPSPFAPGAGSIGILFQGVNESELETGQPRNISPVTVAAAEVKSESGTRQLEVFAGLHETELYHAKRKSNTRTGSDRVVSESEALKSREPGRGAPSETSSPLAGSSPAAFPMAGSPLAGDPPTGDPLSGTPPTGAPRPGSSMERFDAPQAVSPPVARTSASTFAQPITEEGSGGVGEAPAATRTRAFPPDSAHTVELPPTAHDAVSSSLPPMARGQAPFAGSATPAMAPPPGPMADDGLGALPTRGRLVEPAPPSLTIGRIDVLVVAEPKPAAPSTPPRDRGFLSRNYLKRL